MLCGHITISEGRRLGEILTGSKINKTNANLTEENDDGEGKGNNNNKRNRKKKGGLFMLCSNIAIRKGRKRRQFEDQHNEHVPSRSKTRRTNKKENKKKRNRKRKMKQEGSVLVPSLMLGQHVHHLVRKRRRKWLLILLRHGFPLPLLLIILPWDEARKDEPG